ncbi:hypothetical protein ACW9HK_34900, partial [Nocardia gipuzkoensis]
MAATSTICPDSAIMAASAPVGAGLRTDLPAAGQIRAAFRAHRESRTRWAATTAASVGEVVV